MWLWEGELRGLGFRRKSPGYWQCVRNHGLRGDEHVSAYVRAELASPGPRAGLLVELSELHATFPLRENLHFYYHETIESEWEPGGHTSGAEIRRLGLELGRLRDRADRVAGAIIAAMGGELLPRGE